jgi:uncharacterized BrkB/YihY/UPF0761 family membrane protein
MTLEPKAVYVISHSAEFALRTIRGFRANQGLLLAGAVAYYALLSIIPLLILIAIALWNRWAATSVGWRLGKADSSSASWPIS